MSASISSDPIINLPKIRQMASLTELRDQWSDAKLQESNCLKRLLDELENLCESEAFNKAYYDRNWSIQYVSIKEDRVVLRGNYDDEHIEIPFR